MRLKRSLSTDLRTGVTRRHHLEEATLHQAIKIAVGRTGIAKRVSGHTFRHSFATHAFQRGADIRTIVSHASARLTARMAPQKTPVNIGSARMHG